jgi:GT2 family glycosyltransferase
MSKKKVIIIILNWNSYADTIQLLGMLTEQTYKNFQIIIIDNHSTDKSIKKLTPYTRSITFILNKKNLGYACGNNVGIDVAINEQADYIWILNPDIRPRPETLFMLVDSMKQDSSIGAIGPRICYHDDPNKIYSDGGFIFPEKGFVIVHKNHNRNLNETSENKISEVDYVNGSAIFIRLKTLQDIGKFRKDFFLYYEEAEWCLRAKKHGWKIVNMNDAVVYHQSSKKGFRYHYFMARNRIFLARVLRQYRMRSFEVEIAQLSKFLKRPYRQNLIYLTARIMGILYGLIVPPKNTLS